MNWGWTRLEGAAATVYGDTCCGRISDAGLSQLSFGESAMTFFSIDFIFIYLDMFTSLLENMKRTFPCPSCEYTATWSDLKKHIQSIHKGVTFQCSVCESTFTQQGSVQRHIQSVHNGVTFPCEDCEYIATQKGNLQTHIISIHRGVTFPCPDCESTFTQKSNLKHIWNQFTKE